MSNLKISWVTGPDNMGPEMVNWAKELGEKLAEGEIPPRGRFPQGKLTTSQIRKFYGEVKRIQADWKRYQDDIPLLNAKLAYAVGRKGEYGITLFANTFYDAIMKASEKEEYFNRLVKILEATVAYHKFYGGK